MNDENNNENVEIKTFKTLESKTLKKDQSYIIKYTKKNAENKKVEEQILRDRKRSCNVFEEFINTSPFFKRMADIIRHVAVCDFIENLILVSKEIKTKNITKIIDGLLPAILIQLNTELHKLEEEVAEEGKKILDESSKETKCCEKETMH